MRNYERLNRFVTTEKQKGFERNFFVDAEKYEIWEEVKVGAEYKAEKSFEVKAEDIKAFSEAVMDSNPLFNDEEYARKTPWGGLIAHPLFFGAISFYCIGVGHGSWVRTPGAFNPGQKNLLYEPFRVGDIISIKLKCSDKWIKRGRCYLQYQQDFIDQHGKLKLRRWPTLIVPSSRAEVRRYLAIGTHK